MCFVTLNYNTDYEEARPPHLKASLQHCYDLSTFVNLIAYATFPFLQANADEMTLYVWHYSYELCKCQQPASFTGITLSPKSDISP